MQVRADIKNLTFQIEFDGQIPETISSDPTRLRQILINLTGNAVKFTERGGVTLRARLVRLADRPPELEFEVVDSGPGINDEQLTTLFQPFTQADESMTRRFGGTGLGLTISRRLARAMHGSITVSSQLGVGSVFTLRVPTGSLDGVRLIDDPVAALREAREPASVAADTPTQELDCSILLAEDGTDNQRLISHLLRKAGAQVTVADNGQVAVDLAMTAQRTGSPYDVILMDMQMPVLDGYGATRTLRQRDYDGPIIALTAHAMIGDRERCHDAGCNGYATKPINRSHLLAVITSCMGGMPHPVAQD
jgi:CheY-like chemotaxis protein